MCACKLIVVICIPSFFRAFSSVVRQMPGWNPRRWGTARALPNSCVVLCIACFVSFCVLFVCKCVLYYCHWVVIQLQSRNISYHIISRSILRIMMEKNISIFWVQNFAFIRLEHVVMKSHFPLNMVIELTWGTAFCTPMMPLGISDMKVMAPILTGSPEGQQVIDQYNTIVSEVTTDDAVTLNGDGILDVDRITYLEGRYHIPQQLNTTGMEWSGY